ncbi:DUF4043 family protein [Rhizobium tumorigenes]|uniref:DUF4043 family protein n=1 Tax=Rhizobium tumorigenes TaxID=2041385 RepID=A0AAF1KT16_9HYPH|nr:DUF4043 family protein [Rhizobium tumorigenes]WFR98712.1 DUF4043 family protein [Rhizobium tumorigenes]
MAETRVTDGLSPTIWDDQFSVEFFQRNPFSAYAGTGSDNPIVMKEDFASKQGNGITIEFITNLDRGSIRGRQPLRGHEDKLGEFGDKVSWDMRKKGISLHELDVDLAAIDLRKASKGALKTWADEDVKFEVIDRLQDVGQNLDVAYVDATAADKNTWHTNNKDRVLYGNSLGNYTAGNHAASLANITAAGGKFTKDSVSLMKRVALAARPRITPTSIQDDENRRFFVCFVGSLEMRDFVASLNESERQQSVARRSEGMFLGGDREWDGVIVHEVDDMPILAGLGNTGVNVQPAILLGNEALGWGLKARYSSREQKDDYDQVTGLGMIGKWGMKKLGYTIGDAGKTVLLADGSSTNVFGKQRGIVNGFFAATGD